MIGDRSDNPSREGVVVAKQGGLDIGGIVTLIGGVATLLGAMDFAFGNVSRKNWKGPAFKIVGGLAVAGIGILMSHFGV